MRVIGQRAISGRSRMIPARVSTEVISESTDRNCSSNSSSSISNQVWPGPGSGTARKTKMITAVPTSARALSRGSSAMSWRISKSTMAIEPAKTASWARAKSDRPMTRVRATKTSPPMKYHGLAWAASSGRPMACAIASAPTPAARRSRRSRHFCSEARVTPETEIAGIASAIR